MINFGNKPLIRSIALLSLGIVIGWLARKIAVNDDPELNGNASQVAPKASIVAKAAPAVSSSRSANDGIRGDEIVERLRALAWMRSNMQGKVSVQVVAYNGKLNGDSIKILGLTEGEVSVLNQQLKEAKSRLDQASINAATTNMDSENGRFTVHVPAMPTEGGQIRDQLLQSFSGILGQERYGAMIALTGESLDGAFQQFGLADTTYELSLAPTVQMNGEPVYEIKQSNRYPGNNSSTSNSTGKDRRSGEMGSETAALRQPPGHLDRREGTRHGRSHVTAPHHQRGCELPSAIERSSAGTREAIPQRSRH